MKIHKPYSIKVIHSIPNWYCAYCPELIVSGFGKSKKEAIEGCICSIRSTLASHAKFLKDQPNRFKELIEIK